MKLLKVLDKDSIFKVAQYKSHNVKIAYRANYSEYYPGCLMFCSSENALSNDINNKMFLKAKNVTDDVKLTATILILEWPLIMGPLIVLCTIRKYRHFSIGLANLQKIESGCVFAVLDRKEFTFVCKTPHSQ